jgi:hypothetical protein
MINSKDGEQNVIFGIKSFDGFLVIIKLINKGLKHKVNVRLFKFTFPFEVNLWESRGSILKFHKLNFHFENWKSQGVPNFWIKVWEPNLFKLNLIWIIKKVSKIYIIKWGCIFKTKICNRKFSHLYGKESNYQSEFQPFKWQNLRIQSFVIEEFDLTLKRSFKWLLYKPLIWLIWIKYDENINSQNCESHNLGCNHVNWSHYRPF